MTACLTVYCNGPDCPASTVFVAHRDGCFDVPAEGWLHVTVDTGGDVAKKDYCGQNCYAADVMRHAMDGVDRG